MVDSSQQQVQQTSVPVFVPRDPADFLGPRPASGIVGTVLPDGRVMIDYEDGWPDPAGYADLVAQAWGRHEQRYPTVARSMVSAGRLLKVGVFTPSTGIVDITDQECRGALEAWAPGASQHLATTQGQAARRREFQQYLAANPQVRLNPHARKAAARAMHVHMD